MAFTALLKFVLPTQGSLNWGNTANTGLTALVDSAIAGTTEISADADITLTVANGTADEARQAILRWTASGSVTRTITAPAQSKVYVVINQTGGSQNIILNATGPTTGIVIKPGEVCLAAWNGSDYQKIASSYPMTTVQTITSSASITPPASTCQEYTVTALANPATINAPSGTPTSGQKLIIRIKDNGSAQALTWDTSAGGYRAIGVTIPTTTTASKTSYIGCIYNSDAGYWDVIASLTEY